MAEPVKNERLENYLSETFKWHLSKGFVPEDAKYAGQIAETITGKLKNIVGLQTYATDEKFAKTLGNDKLKEYIIELCDHELARIKGLYNIPENVKKAVAEVEPRKGNDYEMIAGEGVDEELLKSYLDNPQKIDADFARTVNDDRERMAESEAIRMGINPIPGYDAKGLTRNPQELEKGL